jgi:uncharacterized protein (TIGR02246 family)
MRTVLLALAAVIIAMPATALAQDTGYKKADFAKLTAKWAKAYNAGDAAGIAALYAEDASLLPPNSAPVEGRAKIEAFWAEAVAAGGSTELTIHEVFSMGETAVEVGMYSGTAADGSHSDHGHYMVVYKQVDGEWKMIRDMWNSDMSQ